MKYISCFLFLFLFQNQVMQAQKEVASLKRYFSEQAAIGQLNGSVLVAEKGKVIYQQSFGYADFERHILNGPGTTFPVASLTKTFTATAILQLANKGKLRVSDPVYKYLSWFPYEAITIRHLLSHTSGLPPYNAFFDSLHYSEPARIFTNADFKEGILQHPKALRYQPGSRDNYDNINFIVLALLVEQVSGTPYNEYISKNILQKANMTQSKLVPFRIQYNDSSHNLTVRPYLFPHLYTDSMVRASRVPYVVNYWSAYNFSGFAELVTTMDDLLKYDQAYYKGTLLPLSAQAEAFTPVRLFSGKNSDANFGLGWEVWTDTTLGKVVYHGGNATGLSCVLIRNITNQQTVIVFDNIHANNSLGLGFTALRLLNGLSVPFPKRSLAAIYARILLRQGADAARDSLYKLKADTMHYSLSEDELNSLGYDFMGGPNNTNPYHFAEEHKYTEALATFKLNMELFPNSWNVYDSYGEMLLLAGRKKEAIEMYQRSIALNPANEGGKKVLRALLQ